MATRWSALVLIPLASLVGGCAGTAGVTESSALSSRASVSLPVVDGVEPQPLMAQVARMVEALAFLGSELAPDVQRRLDACRDQAGSPELVRAIQELLDPQCLAMVHINPEARVKVRRGPARAELMQNGWRTYLVKVHNEGGVTAPLQVTSPNALPLVRRSNGAARPERDGAMTGGGLADRFLDVVVADRRPLSEHLSGLGLEYVVVQLYSRDAGAREARLAFRAGQGSQDLGFRETLDVLFDCRPAVRTVLRVRDANGRPTMASFVISDRVRRRESAWAAGWVSVYPLPSRRLARDDEYPDFFFQPQVYRQDGEHVDLPPGQYEITVRRGPESLPQTRTVTIPEGVERHQLEFTIEQWADLSELGWYSVDHHVHSAGCSHYDAPAEGVRPEHMWRQALGEDLDVCCVLSWGPCWYHQKGYFEGDVHALSTEQNLLRFDVEVSGFPSSHAGHVCLLRLKEDDYPGAESIEQWPSWTLPVLQWAKEQGGIVGYAHSGLGLEPMRPTEELPNYVMARFNSIGANEYIVTVTHDAVDFISAGDTKAQHELNIWYHTLNCGFRTRISGETDFPCLSDGRIGRARSYVKADRLDFDTCLEQIKKGHSYVSDGYSHLIDFRVGAVEVGTKDSELRLDRPGPVTVRARVAAHLPAEPPSRGPAPDGVPPDWFRRNAHWDLERARIADTRKVPVELVVNGIAVERREIVADGQWNAVEFETRIEDSSWVALRILPSSHTNPGFVLVGDRPIRASERSAKWCREAVDQCWKMKSPQIEAEDRAAAQQGYQHARDVYDRIVDEARRRAGHRVHGRSRGRR